MFVDIIIFIVVLAVLILVHEWGHFLAARRTGMKVDEFGIGFPPRLWSWQRGETLWSINVIPLGGFVKIAGEDGTDADLCGLNADRRGQNTAVEITVEEKEISVTTDGEVMEKDVFVEEKFFPTKEASGKSGYFSDKPIWQRAIVLSAGGLMNFVLGWLLLSIVFSFGTANIVLISDVAANSPAELAGIVAGDRILGFPDIDSFTDFVNRNKGQEISFTVEGGGGEKEIKLVPRKEIPPGQGAIGVALVMGGVQKIPWYQSIWEALKTSVEIFGFIFVMLFRLIAGFFGGENLFGYLSGPIGIYRATTQAAGLGIIYLLNLTALISLNLAALNIFPFPALDGGRVIFLAIEKIKGSPVSLKIQQIVNGVGFALMILLLVVVSVKDVLKLLV